MEATDWTGAGSLSMSAGPGGGGLSQGNMDFSGNASFVFQANLGVPTMTIGQNSVCDPRSHRCDSFASITCQ